MPDGQAGAGEHLVGARALQREHGVVVVLVDHDDALGRGGRGASATTCGARWRRWG